jgi:integrase/recombinase XerD
MSARQSIVRQISILVRRARLDYPTFRRVYIAVRQQLNLRPPKRPQHLPKILPEASLRRFYETIDRAGNLQHQIMLRLLLYTGIRVSELTAIAVEDIDLAACKIFVSQGKGQKDRYILFPESFRLILAAHLKANPKNRYLFESQQRTKFSTRRIQYIVAHYAREAGIPERIHPHLLRHQMLTWLTAKGLPDAQIQLISGHTSKKSLEVYQHLALKDVAPNYQKAMKEMEL